MSSNRAAAIWFTITALIIAAAFAVPAAERAVPAPVPEPPADLAERARLQAHLKRVEAELRAAEVSHLRPSQRAARERHLDVLREYRLAGQFPHNHGRPGEMPPIFVDEHGTRCAMAYLIARSGRTDIVERVATTRNYAYIGDLADDTALVAWLDAAGLSVEEAARIQPWYNWQPQEREQTVSGGYATASALLLGLNGAAVLNNLLVANRAPESNRWSGWLGLAAGAASAGLGATKLNGDGEARTLGIVNTSVGVLSATLGTVTLRRRTSSPRAAASGEPVIEAAPLVGSEGSGLLFRLRF